MKSYDDLVDENEQLRHTLQTVVREIKDLNILNAKLLYVGKLFRRLGLSADTKLWIVEQMDACTTLPAIRALYDELLEEYQALDEDREDWQ